MSHGATPPGISNKEESARWVRGMFGRVAHRYDFLNHLLSMHQDRYWRWRTVRRLRSVLENPRVRVLDICCGSGDLMLALERSSPGRILGSDFCHPMLIESRNKIARRRSRAVLFEADALSLPIPDASIELLTVAFGFRNLADYTAGLAEMLRVLAPGGTAAILEFSTPPNRLFRSIYNAYSHRVLPVIGGLLSGSREAYSYLPDSVRKFPGPEDLARQMRDVGFADVSHQLMTGGIVALHTGKRPSYEASG